MAQQHDAGGSGEVSGEVSMVFGAQRGAELGLAAVADDLDAAGSQMPEGDYGEAGALIANLMAAYFEASAQLVTEAKILALGVRVATGEMSGTDVEQAVDFMGVARQ